MARVEKTVFISYRRQARPGRWPSSRTSTTTDIDVFFDYEGIARWQVSGFVLLDSTPLKCFLATPGIKVKTPPRKPRYRPHHPCPCHQPHEVANLNRVRQNTNQRRYSGSRMNANEANQ
jgi:hypothetical protein